MSIEVKIAESYLASKLSILPAVREKKCPAVGKWKTWQERLPTEIEARAWFANCHDAVCLVCGKVSGNLEILDFDHHGELFPKWKESLPRELFDKLVIEETPSGGFHAAYRSAGEIDGSLKLARGVRENKLVTLIETRGAGGLFLCYPTLGYTLKQGSFTSLPVLTAEERQTLLFAARALNEEISSEPKAPQNFSQKALFLDRPGDEYNEFGDVRALLLAHGWTLVRSENGSDYFKRPNKPGSCWSATLKDRIFYVFSSNACPFEPNKAYSPFNVYALLEHNGDYSAAAQALLRQGLGKAGESNGVDLSPFMARLSSAAPSRPARSNIRSLGELVECFPEMKPALIHGILRIGETMNIVAPPKIGKSWLAADLACAVAAGSPWLGCPCEQGKVLIIDNELHPESSACRIPKVVEARRYPENIVKQNLFIENQRGALQSIYDLNSRLEELKSYGFKLIIIDAFYRAMPPGTEENDNAKLAEIYNRIDYYAAELNCAFALIHHTSKGNQANKSVTDVGAGAGSQSRAADTHIILRRHEEAGAVVMDAAVRSFPQAAPIVLRWNYPLWDFDFSLDPAALAGKLDEAPPKVINRDINEEARFAAALLGSPMPKTEFIAAIQSNMALSRSRARNVLDRAKNLNLLRETLVTDANNPRRNVKLISHG